MRPKLLLTTILFVTLFNFKAIGQHPTSDSKTSGSDYEKELTRLTTLVDAKDREITRVREEANSLIVQLENLKNQQNLPTEPKKNVWATEPKVQADDLLDQIVTERQKAYHVRRNYIRGPRGGCYYINTHGNKSYVDRSLCN